MRSLHEQFPAQYTFATFLADDSNQLAYTAAQAVVKRPGHYNPLYVYGDLGLGKSHLLMAIGFELTDGDENINVGYVVASELIRPTSTSLVEQLLDLDVLLIDDLGELGVNKSGQDEFLHIFEALFPLQQVVVASREAPRQTGGLTVRLAEKLSLGLAVKLERPSVSCLESFLQSGAEARGITLPLKAALEISHRARSFRQIEVVLNQLSAVQELTGALHANVVSQVLQMIYGNTVNSAQKILEMVSVEFEIPMDQITSDSRLVPLISARSAFVYLCRRYTTASYPFLGKFLGGRDHTTIIAANKRAEAKIRKDPNFRDHLARLEALLGQTPTA